MDLVCLDTQILIWGIKEDATPGQEDMIRRAKFLFRQLSELKSRILIPSIVIAEFLIRIPPEVHTTVLNLMREGFVTAPFDLPAASRFAILWNEQQQNNVIRDLQQIHKATREELKVDCLIVATALAREAACIYSHDVKLKTFAGESIQVLELPVGEEQMNLI